MSTLEHTVEPRQCSTPPLKLGVRAHDFGCLPVQELAGRIATKGFGCVQLALNKAIAGLKLRAGDLNPALAGEIRNTFRRQGVEIAVLGCYINPIHPDWATRRQLLEFFKDHLRWARDFGCGMVALESGSVNADYSPHPANDSEAAFGTLLCSLGELVATAGDFGIHVGLEAVIGHTVSTPKKLHRVLETISSRHLQVVLDPVNLLCAANLSRQNEVIAEAIDLFGDRVAVVHAKDFILAEGALKTVPAGRGQLDYGPIMDFVRRHAAGTPVLLEEAGESVAPESAGFLRQKFMEVAL